MTARLSALVLDGGSGQSLAVARKLGATGWRIVTEAGTRTARSRFTTSAVAVPSTQDGPAEYMSSLEAISAGHAIDLVVPTNDLTLELCWSASKRLGGARIFGGDRRAVETFLDKAAGIAAAERCGFPVPRTLIPATLEQVGAAAEEIGFPCVIKPRRSFVTSTTGIRHLRHVVVSTPEQAEAAAFALCDADGAPPVVQAFVEGRAVAATFVVRDGRTFARAVRETLSFWPVTGGMSVWKRSLPLDSPGVAEAERFLLAFGLEGLAEIEYQLDGSDVPRLMEVGPRAHGWIPLAEASCPGLIETAATVAVGGEARELTEYRPGIEMRWLRGELARTRFALRSSVDLPPGVSRGRVLRAGLPLWRPGMRYDIIDLGDPLPWLPRGAARLLRAAFGARRSARTES